MNLANIIIKIDSQVTIYSSVRRLYRQKISNLIELFYQSVGTLRMSDSLTAIGDN